MHNLFVLITLNTMNSLLKYLSFAVLLNLTISCSNNDSEEVYEDLPSLEERLHARKHVVIVAAEGAGQHARSEDGRASSRHPCRAREDGEGRAAKTRGDGD